MRGNLVSNTNLHKVVFFLKVIYIIGTQKPLNKIRKGKKEKATATSYGGTSL